MCVSNKTWIFQGKGIFVTYGLQLNFQRIFFILAIYKLFLQSTLSILTEDLCIDSQLSENNRVNKSTYTDRTFQCLRKPFLKIEKKIDFFYYYSSTSTINIYSQMRNYETVGSKSLKVFSYKIVTFRSFSCIQNSREFKNEVS